MALATFLPQNFFQAICFLIIECTTYAAYLIISDSNANNSKIIPSPLKYIHTYKSQDLSYPPSDYIPGARDVSTPWGNLRVYEFGPENAKRKVLLVHGISTPCTTLAAIAERLAKKGCRVMLFDAFGRGWSDAPPVDHDEGLFTSMIFCALASSALPWTGVGQGYGGFSLIGYSLGGCIAANFASHFPELVEDLVLITPAGLLRSDKHTWSVKLFLSGLIPVPIALNMLHRRLTAATKVVTTHQGTSPIKIEDADDESLITAEAPDPDSKLPMAFGRILDIQGAIRWQMANHQGFMRAYLSSFIHAPLHDQHERWRLIGSRLNDQRKQQVLTKNAYPQGFRSGRVIIFAGVTDHIIQLADLEVGVNETLGASNVEMHRIDCGHDLPILYSEEVVETIWKTWFPAT